MEANLKGFVCYTVNHENKRIRSLREKKEEKKRIKKGFILSVPGSVEPDALYKHKQYIYTILIILYICLSIYLYLFINLSVNPYPTISLSIHLYFPMYTVHLYITITSIKMQQKESLMPITTSVNAKTTTMIITIPRSLYLHPPAAFAPGGGNKYEHSISF